MYQNEKINKELKSIISQFRDSYHMTCDSSRNEYMKTLAPGAQVPKEGVIYGADHTMEFASMCDGYRKRAQDLLEKALDDLKEKATEAPSTEAVNSIVLLNMRKNITEDEIDNLLTRYGENPQAWETINSIAKEHDIHVFRDHEIKGQIESVEALLKNLSKILDAPSAISGLASNGFISMLEMDIDKAFPIGE